MLRTIPAVKMAMTPFPQTIQLEAPVAEAWRMMTELGVRHLPVADGSRLVGVVSGRDLGLAMDSRLGTPEARGVLVSDVCERHAFVVDLETPVDL
ncbi:MAG: CBS domain-containing protein, partial [Holophagales bacterium]|nr:CBS domain-containing protein [Holophagales bacterium]